MVRVGRYLIYGLLDPRDNSLRYIGKTHKRKEWRLREHIELAKENNPRSVYKWIRQLLKNELEPLIFILKRISAEDDWRLAEKEVISYWANPKNIKYPYTYPAQTKKSTSVIIKSVKLENLTDGG